MDPAFAAKLREKLGTGAADERIKAVQRLVLRLGGGRGRFQLPWVLREELRAPFARLLLEESEAFGPPARIARRAPARECHANSLGRALDTGELLYIGFALSDGIWRIHSWTVGDDGRVTENTPTTRSRYVGAPITTQARLRAAWPAAADMAREKGWVLPR